MKKFLSYCLAFLILLTLPGCAGFLDGKILGLNRSPIYQWGTEEFSFYDGSGNEVDFPTDDSLMLSSCNQKNSGNFQTKRGVKIGQRATAALNNYELDYFKWAVNKIGKTDAEAQRYQGIHDRYKTATEALAHTKDFLGQDESLYMWMEFYLDADDNLVPFLLDENGDFLDDKWASGRDTYSIRFTIKNEKIKEVTVEHRKGVPILIRNEVKSFPDTLLHDRRLSWDMKKSDIEQVVGPLVDRTSEIGFTARYSESRNIDIEGHSFFVRYLFDKSGRLSNVSYISDNSENAMGAITKFMNSKFGEPIALEKHKYFASDIPYWAVNCKGFRYSADIAIHPNVMIVFCSRSEDSE